MQFSYERNWRVAAFISALHAQSHDEQSMCMLEIRKSDRTLCLVCVSSFKPNLVLQLRQFKSCLASALHVRRIMFRSVGEEQMVFCGYSNTFFFCYMSVHTISYICSNLFLTTAGSGQNWTSSKCFRPSSHLYLASSTCGSIYQNVS